MESVSSTTQDWDVGPGLLDSMLRYKWIVLASAVLFAAAGYGWSTQQPVEYESSAELLLKDPGSVRVFEEIRGMGDPARYTRNQAAVMASSDVMRRATELADVDITISELAEQTSIEPDAEVDRITVTVRHRTAEGAAELADSVSLAYEQVAAEQLDEDVETAIVELQEAQQDLERQLAQVDEALDDQPEDPGLFSEREALSQELANVRTRARQLSVDASLFGGGVETREPAVVPQNPVQPRPLRAAAVSLVLGVAASGALAWKRNGRRVEEPRVRAERVLGAPLLGEVPKYVEKDGGGELPTVYAPRSAPAEAYQFLLAALSFTLQEHNARVVLLTSARAGEGKTVTAANLAAAATQGTRIILIDADVRARRLTRLSGQTDSAALSSLASESVPPEWAVGRWRLSEDVVIPFVRGLDADEAPDPAAFFRSATFVQALARLREHADLVLIDSSPLLAVADAFEIAAHVDATVLVTTPDTPEDQLAEAKRRLEMLGTPLIGYVLNQAAVDTSPYSYGYEEVAPPVGAVSGGAPGQRRPHRANVARSSASPQSWSLEPDFARTEVAGSAENGNRRGALVQPSAERGEANQRLAAPSRE